MVDGGVVVLVFVVKVVNGIVFKEVKINGVKVDEFVKVEKEEVKEELKEKKDEFLVEKIKEKFEEVLEFVDKMDVDEVSL